MSTKSHSTSSTLLALTFQRMMTLTRLPWARLTIAATILSVCVGTSEGQSSAPRVKVSLPVNPELLARTAPSVVRAPLFAPADTFVLHSRPTASKVIYLDFDGHVTTNSGWNSASLPSITTSAFTIDSTPTFTSTELARIQEIWQRVAECYSPFDVDVTTQAPVQADLDRTSSSDTKWGVRVAIGAANPSPAPGAGGVAYVGVFGRLGLAAYTTAFVFSDALGNGHAKYTADAIVHEVGHTLGLDHDGRTNPSEEYYAGHGTGLTGWAPHLGVGYGKNLVQWSKGEYLNASNSEDDLLIITRDSGFGFRVDDFANSQSTAVAILGTKTGTTFNIDQSGVIEQRTDSDWFKLVAGAGALTLTAKGASINTMLDIKLDLYDSNGLLVNSSNPVSDTSASISRTLTAGTYFVKIDGVGLGDPKGTGYSDYGSLGRYRITGSFVQTSSTPSNVTATYVAATKTLTLTGDTGRNSLSLRFVSGALQLQGDGTTINNRSTVSFPHTGKLVLNVDLKQGNDSLTIIGVESSKATIQLGAGTDSLSLAYCNVTKLIVDGGTEVDTLLTTSSVIKSRSVKNVP